MSKVSCQELVLRPIVFTQPLRIVEPQYWVPHIPFAFWIVEALRPRTFVELGTMSGNSYSAFAQAVQLHSVECACYAIDTWKGDQHTGQYGPDVFEDWRPFHDQHFGAFSRPGQRVLRGRAQKPRIRRDARAAPGRQGCTPKATGRGRIANAACAPQARCRRRRSAART